MIQRVRRNGRVERRRIQGVDGDRLRTEECKNRVVQAFVRAAEHKSVLVRADVDESPATRDRRGAVVPVQNVPPRLSGVVAPVEKAPQEKGDAIERQDGRKEDGRVRRAHHDAFDAVSEEPAVGRKEVSSERQNGPARAAVRAAKETDLRPRVEDVAVIRVDGQRQDPAPVGDHRSKTHPIARSPCAKRARPVARGRTRPQRGTSPTSPGGGATRKWTSDSERSSGTAFTVEYTEKGRSPSVHPGLRPARGFTA